MGGILDTIVEKFGFGATPTPTPSPVDMTKEYADYNSENEDLSPTEWMLQVMGKRRGEPGYGTSEEIINQYLKFKGNTSASAKELEQLMIAALMGGKEFATPVPGTPTPTPTIDWLKESDVGGVNAPINYIKTPTPTSTPRR